MNGIGRWIPRTPTACTGFTLVEMLAALALIGMMAGLLLPNFQRWFASTEQRVNASALAIQLQNLHVRAALAGHDFELTVQSASANLADGRPAINLPQGWRLHENTRLRVRASGYCENAHVDFEGPASPLRLYIHAPNCEVTRVGPAV